VIAAWSGILLTLGLEEGGDPLGMIARGSEHPPVVVVRGNPAELGHEYATLSKILPDLRGFGGCYGADHHHIEEICKEVSRAC